MRFDGFVISDWEGIHQIPGDWPTQVRTGVNAGIDMMMEPNAYQNFITTLLDEVHAGHVPMSRIDDAVSRILTKKFELGLFEHPFTDRRNIDEIGSRAHHRVAREAAAKSSVLLKNKHETLPLRTRKARVRGGLERRQHRKPGRRLDADLAGRLDERDPGNDDPGRDPRARTGSRDVTAATRRRRYGRATPGIVVVGETPYSEGFGDVGGPRWGFDPGDDGELRPVKDMQLSAEDKAAVDKVCAEAAQVRRGRGLRSPADHRPAAAGLDRRAGGCLAPGERGRGRGRHAVRATRIHRQAAGDAGRERSLRSRSTSATPTMTRSTRSGTA